MNLKTELLLGDKKVFGLMSELLLQRMAKNSVHLPLELIREILLRLPVKSVLGFRCVCKSWLSLISDPKFATSHFQLAASPTTHGLVFLKTYSPGDPKALIIDFDASLSDDSSYASLSLDFLSRSEFGGSCRGFLFLHRKKDFYLWNPSTGAHKHIRYSPSPDIIAWRERCERPQSQSASILMYGFGYNPSRDDYLIVVGSYDPIISALVSTSIDLGIFSLRANKWKHIDSCLPYNDDPFGGDFKVGLFSSGALHWPLYNHKTRRDVIVAFDLKEMTISDIALPDDFSCSDYPEEYDLLIFRELISVWIEEKGKIDIWVMQEYAVKSSWTKSFVFSLDPSPRFCPLHFTNCGHIVGIDRCRRELVKFNDKGQLLEEQSHLNCFSDKSRVLVYTESMLSLPLPSATEQAQEDD